MTEPLGNVFCKGCVILGSGCLRCGRCAVGLAKQQASAVATLKRLGYTDRGGEQWAPPIGNAPDFNLLDAANAQIAELQSQLSAIGAGGVESLRKREQAEPVTWTPGPNEFKDWCSQWFGPDSDDSYLAKAVFNIPPMAQKFDRAALQAAPPAPAAATLPEGWTVCRIEHEPGYPEDVAFGPQIMMDRLKKWLDRHFAALAAAPAQAVAVPSDHQCKLLAEALGECIMAAGIVRKDIDGLSGPQLLMFAEDLKRHLAAPAQEDAALQQYEAFFDQVFAQACSNGLFDAWGKRVDCTRLNEAHQLACDAKKGGAA